MCVFEVLALFSSLGYLRAKFCFFCTLHCWASPWRIIAYSITHSLSQLIWCLGTGDESELGTYGCGTCTLVYCACLVEMRHKPWTTWDEGVSPGCTRAVRKTIFFLSLQLRLAGSVMVNRSTRLCCCAHTTHRSFHLQRHFNIATRWLYSRWCCQHHQL